MTDLQKWTEVAEDLWSTPVQGGVIYRLSRSTNAHIAFAPWPQQQLGLGGAGHYYPAMPPQQQHFTIWPQQGAGLQ